MRDTVRTFDRRAENYERGALGRWHRRIAERAADAATAFAPIPLRVLDIGCGTGLLLRELSYRLPNAIELVGLDPAPRMLAEAADVDDGQLWFVRALAERLPLPDEHFDLIVSCLSFDHWADQRRGMAEVARVLAPNGTFVLIDLCAFWLPRGGRARRPADLAALASAGGLIVDGHEAVGRLAGLPLIRATRLVR